MGKGYWLAGYPWIKDPTNLPNNRNDAIKLLLQIEKGLNRDPTYKKLYSDQIENMLSREVGRKLTQREINKYNGPIHFIAHHAILKPTSRPYGPYLTQVQIFKDTHSPITGRRAPMCF